MRNRRSCWICPFGECLVVVSFFLPWMEVSCSEHIGISVGVEVGGMYWCIFGLSIIVMLACYYFRKLRQSENAKFLILVGTLLSMAIFIYEFIDIHTSSTVSFFGYDLLRDEIDLRYLYGYFLMFAGLLISLAGAFAYGRSHGAVRYW